MSYASVSQQTLLLTRRLLAAAPGLNPHAELATDPMLLGRWTALTCPERRTLLLTAAWMAHTNESVPADLTEGRLAVGLLRLARQWAAHREGEGTLSGSAPSRIPHTESRRSSRRAAAFWGYWSC